MAVYIAMCRHDGVVKIGTSKDVEKRIKEVSRDSGCDLVLLRVLDGSYPEEGWMHMRFSEQNVTGEWFEFHKEMLKETPPQNAAQELRKMREKQTAYVRFSEEEMEIIEAAMEHLGIRNIKSFLRYAALSVARKGDA